MYIGCKSGLFDNDCAISPATFYREYIFGKSSEEVDNASKSWDLLKRGITVVLVLVFTFITMRNYILPSQRNLPVVFILLSAWIAFGIPFTLNWLTTIDAERRVANDETSKVKVGDKDVKRDYKGWSCVMNLSLIHN